METPSLPPRGLGHVLGAPWRKPLRSTCTWRIQKATTPPKVHVKHPHTNTHTHTHTFEVWLHAPRSGLRYGTHKARPMPQRGAPKNARGLRFRGTVLHVSLWGVRMYPCTLESCPGRRRPRRGGNESIASPGKSNRCAPQNGTRLHMNA
jgi:hypothetical protein